MGAQCLGKAASLEDALKKKVLEITPRYLGSSEPQVLISSPEKYPGETWETRGWP